MFCLSVRAQWVNTNQVTAPCKMSCKFKTLQVKCSAPHFPNGNPSMPYRNLWQQISVPVYPSTNPCFLHFIFYIHPLVICPSVNGFICFSRALETPSRELQTVSCLSCSPSQSAPVSPPCSAAAPAGSGLGPPTHPTTVVWAWMWRPPHNQRTPRISALVAGRTAADPGSEWLDGARSYPGWLSETLFTLLSRAVLRWPHPLL